MGAQGWVSALRAGFRKGTTSSTVSPFHGPKVHTPQGHTVYARDSQSAASPKLIVGTSHRGGPAKGILFRNTVQHGSVTQHAIARATGQQDASRCRAKFPLLGVRMVFFSFRIAGRETGGKMSTEPQRTCPSCGNELSGAIEFCPVCMLRKGLAEGAESGESSSRDTLKPIPDQPAQRFDHYELATGEDGKPVELGRGAMGVTYKAFDINLRCPVTLKVISERYVHRIEITASGSTQVEDRSDMIRPEAEGASD